MAFDIFTGPYFGWSPAKLTRCDEKTSRTWINCCKTIIVIPAAVEAFAARGSWRFIRGHPELKAWPYYEGSDLALFLTYIACITIFPWCFVSVALVDRKRGPWLLLWGLIDLGLAVVLAIGIMKQAIFLPGTYRGCGGGKADSWQVVGDHKSFFVLSAEIAGGKATAQGVCRDYVSDWTIAIAVLFFQLVASYIGIFFDEREYSILNPMRPITWIFILFIWPPLFVHRHVLPKIRLGFSYLKKSIRHVRQVKEFGIPEPTQYKSSGQHFEVPESKLMDILVIEHVLLRVVDFMHYEDVVNFSMSCRAVRETVFPPLDLEHRVPKLRKRCCDLSTKKGCLYCNKKICYPCKSQRFLPGLPGRRHVTTCKPYCSTCYYKHYSQHPRGYKRPCKCHTTDRSLEFQDMCKSCFAKDQVQIQVDRHKRYQQQARDIAFGVGLNEGQKVCCGSCKAELKSGTRWWVCGKCRGECRDAIHPPYVRKMKAVDVEKGGGGSRVVEEGAEPWWKRWAGL